ncbi:MAG: glycosyl transferase [Ardenticatenia bacterium]|nr:MAG: glycosyl transferase [Ardenticatenia bacterium]
MNVMPLLLTLSGLAWALVALGVGYHWLLAWGSLRRKDISLPATPTHRFAVLIPAHNEEAVIGRTLDRLHSQRYPRQLYDVFVVADHCTDGTATLAREYGAMCYERSVPPRGSKGAALAWLIARVFQTGVPYDALVIFDADTQVDADFLRVMDARLAQGDRVVQGQHRISNPGAGWFAALIWAMFMIDNRFQNLGRSNLGFSAKIMGDSICFRADLLRQLGWGTTGLTEDFEMGLRLLLEGVRVVYEPAAVGCGEAPPTWTAARAQRARWLRGAAEAKSRYGWRLLREGVRRRDFAMLEGAARSLLPVYSTLALVSLLGTLVHLAFFVRSGIVLTGLWALLVVLLGVYPFFGLLLERAPLRAYAAILAGPLFIFWRTWLSLRARYGRRPVQWVRTEHGMG